MKIQDTKVSSRLILGFGLVLSLLIIVVILGIGYLQQMHQRMEQIVRFNDEESKLAQTMYLTVTERALAMRNLILLTDEKESQMEVDRIAAQKKKYADAVDKLEKLLTNDPTPTQMQLSLIGDIKKQALLAEPYIVKALDLYTQKKNDEAYKLLRFEYRPVQKKWWDLINEFIKDETEQNKEAVAQAESDYKDARNMMLLFGTVALLFGVLASWMIIRSLLRQLGGEPRYAVQIAEKIANGDLSVDIHIQSDDEHSLMHALKNMRNGLSEIVGQVRHGTETIASASTQIATGNMDLSSRSEQQAGSLEETASSMEELTSTVKQNSDNAKQANQLALSASDVAVKGGAVVSEVVQTMGAINESSRKIVDIISVIDGIAFQTNILALNAAVEAARAGEQGRGFAVVATEVRNLAQRSAEAAREIKKLIDDSVSKVETGAKLVDQAGSTMAEIVGSIQKVTGIMNEIMLATEEQTTGIEQINEAIVQMDDVTQQNAALVEEAAAAATSLQDQADELRNLVSTFRLQPSSPEANAAVQPHVHSKVVALPKKHPVMKTNTHNVMPVKKIANAASVKNEEAAEWAEF
ncbi:methyl-accepting chemotaxis protein [Undibacterium griseum]|uniref:MCP four helix bundle domain-containing protein n=1 Tax=Undibacterium griseum TaxID=2762295 RepID=A0ABR6YM45_9BURK|nr:methyl-accepting chemotaxis protein [Undibacterium griseum]MBC3884970.1 MCP four helix bundle domain-containing protein [Undibacterium griseum]